MKKAYATLWGRGYRKFDETASRECYDYTCRKNGKLYYVEVKGTQTNGNSVILTRNEVDNALYYPDSSIFVLVSAVRVKDKPQISVGGGQVTVREKWMPRKQDLKPIQYMWKVH
jgi:hypothetical protein